MLQKQYELNSVRGIGEKTINVLSKKNITTVNDLLLLLPISYGYYSNNIDFDQAKQNIIMNGTIITNIGEYRPRSNLLITKFTISDGKSSVPVVAWNQRHLRFAYNQGDQVEITGTLNADQTVTLKTIKKIEFENSSNQAVQNGETEVNKIISIYPKINQLSNPKLSKLIEKSLAIIDSSEPLKETLHALHFPESNEQLLAAQLAFKKYEFQNYLTKIRKLQSKTITNNPKYAIASNQQFLTNQLVKLPFSLTSAQDQALNDIIKKLIAPAPAQSLLIGDVGSGKTIIALLAAYLVVCDGGQVAFMAPTDILAEQIYRQAQLFFPTVKTELLTGSLKKLEKKRLKSYLQVGNIDLIVGTHALIEEDVLFKNLKFVVIDEQHRFGVNQRMALQNKGQFVNTMYLSATPIPRTIAHTIFGMIDIIEMKEKPQNRQPIITKVFPKSNKQERQQVYQVLEAELKKGNQAFVVCPLVEEVEDLKLANVEDTFASFTKYCADQFVVGRLHGQMKAGDKSIIMQKFRNKEYDLLVSTTVIEVGVDIPDATVMLILNAERFGVAQLHQLRGRVGRNNMQSYCFLQDNSAHADSTKRLKLLEASDNGFELAIKDYETRGMGELVGVRQSGNEDFYLFDFRSDMELAEILISENVAK